jgi:hypothetical protein
MVEIRRFTAEDAEAAEGTGEGQNPRTLCPVFLRGLCVLRG